MKAIQTDENSFLNSPMVFEKLGQRFQNVSQQRAHAPGVRYSVFFVKFYGVNCRRHSYPGCQMKVFFLLLLLLAVVDIMGIHKSTT